MEFADSANISYGGLDQIFKGLNDEDVPAK